MTSQTVFHIFHNGKKIDLNSFMDSEEKNSSQVIRFASTDDEIFILFKNQQLFHGNYNVNTDKESSNEQLDIKNLLLWKTDILDLDLYCNFLYLLQKNGQILRKDLNSKNSELEEYSRIDDVKDKICKIKVNSIGILYLTESGKLYGQGKCGKILKNNDQPESIMDYLNEQKVLDISCGNDFFIILAEDYGENLTDFRDTITYAASNFLRKPSLKRSETMQIIIQEDSSDNNSVKSESISSETEKTSIAKEKRKKSFTKISADESKSVIANLEMKENCPISENATTIENQESVNVLRHDENLKSVSIPVPELINKDSSIDDSGFQESSSDVLEQTNEAFFDDFETRLNNLIETGKNLINTVVYSFGVSNMSVLGTGDHIKRTGINSVLKLSGIGCYSICSGKEHSLARTLDGRIFHWGFNDRKQLLDNDDSHDLSTPKELNIKNILEATCSDYRTIFCDTKLDIFQSPTTSKITMEEKFLKVHSVAEKNFPIILQSQHFTLLNSIVLELDYHEYLESVQHCVQKLLKNLHFVRFLKTKITINLRFTQKICTLYIKMLYSMVACLKSIEDFYRRDIDFSELLFLKNSSEMIKLYSDYVKQYSDLLAVNAFSELNRNLRMLIEVGNYEEFFYQPISQISIFQQFCEKLYKINSGNKQRILNYISEKLQEWNDFARKQRIEQEEAEATREFWLKNSKNSQLKLFKKRSRRVILDTSICPLKSTSTGSSSVFTSSGFILFSDCLCQYGRQIQIYPLTSMWIRVEDDLSFRIYTPESNFLVSTTKEEHKRLWLSQIEERILRAIQKPENGKLSDIRNTNYNFSEKHPFYPRVRAYGRWRLGIMHGTCYLEYPDGKLYYGEIKNSIIDGYGKMVIPSSGVYEGYFKNGKFDGFGTYEQKDEIYSGHFRDGYYNGHGMLTTSRYTYIGEFLANMKNGYGVLDDNISGDKYMGMFVENKKNGVGICIQINGDYFEGFFTNDIEISGDGLAVFENGCSYEGEMKISGPNGRGQYFIPIREAENDDIWQNNSQMLGNILSGNLSGNWNDVKIVNGHLDMNKKFSKYPSKVGELVVDNYRKWRSLFDNWEEQIFGIKKSNKSPNRKEIWNRIAVFITGQREKTKESDLFQNITLSSSAFAKSSFFQENLKLHSQYDNSLMSLDKISIKSSASLYSKRNSNSTLEIRDKRKKSHSNESINFDKTFDFIDFNLDDSDDENYTQNFFINLPIFSSASNNSSSRSSSESSSAFDNLDIVPDFGFNDLILTVEEFQKIQNYLKQAFEDKFHPLNLLNQRITECFCISYSQWKVKPTPVLAKQAIGEFESIILRIYNIIRKMFPNLPESECEITGYGERISHISLLYPIVLTEGIYSTLFVLYANKCAKKDELYRQKLNLINEKNDFELAKLLSFNSFHMRITKNIIFHEAIKTIKLISKEYSPKLMLDAIENSIQLVDEAYKNTASDGCDKTFLSGDTLLPLIIYLILRAQVPLLGAELELLDDLTNNLQLDMNGQSGYCFTTIKVAYEHITIGNLIKS